MSNQIRCPHCRAEFEVTQAVAEQVRESLASEFDAQSKLRDEAFAQRERNLDALIRDRITAEQPRLLKEARDAVAGDLKSRDDRLLETQSRLDAAHAVELQLRKERRDFDEERRIMELTVQRTLDAERGKIREESMRQADEAFRLKEADHLKLADDMRKQIDELKRKAELGIPSVQGEVMELALEELLRNQFPHDDIEAVPVGLHGGDVIQRVRDPQGASCGMILWESKRTKTWNDVWLTKLRDDQAACRADMSAILSEQLPKGVTTFSCIDGVWVTGRSCLQGLAVALRAGLIEVARARRSMEGRQSKADHLVGYLSSSAFRLTIEGVVEIYESMKEDTTAERRAHQRMWLKREKQLERAIGNVTGIIGELSCIMDANLPVITKLEAATAPAEIGEEFVSI